MTAERMIDLTLLAYEANSMKHIYISINWFKPDERYGSGHIRISDYTDPNNDKFTYYYDGETEEDGSHVYDPGFVKAEAEMRRIINVSTVG